MSMCMSAGMFERECVDVCMYVQECEYMHECVQVCKCV